VTDGRQKKKKTRKFNVMSWSVSKSDPALRDAYRVVEFDEVCEAGGVVVQPIWRGILGRKGKRQLVAVVRMR
jgi:hypothetical protein